MRSFIKYWILKSQGNVKIAKHYYNKPIPFPEESVYLIVGVLGSIKKN